MRGVMVQALLIGGALVAGTGTVSGEDVRLRLSQAANSCAAKNPCAAKAAAPVKDSVAEAAFKQYKSWKKVNTEPVLSATHGNRYVFTYLNKKAEPSGLQG